MRINLLFGSQYTSQSNFNSISSFGEILDANVDSNGYLDFNEVQRRCLDFACDLVIFLKCHEYKLVV